MGLVFKGWLKDKKKAKTPKLSEKSLAQQRCRTFCVKRIPYLFNVGGKKMRGVL